MNVIICHNFYQQAGGEDQVFAEETELLQRNGHRVTRYTLNNESIKAGGGVPVQLRLLGNTFWNKKAYAELNALVREEHAEIVHFHNTFPLMSPAAYYAAREAGAAVVQTLHNYRLLCPNGTFYREGQTCEKCLGRSPWPGVVHNCYRDSLAASTVAAAMLTAHWAMGTYRSAVDIYIALTEFAQEKFVQGGLPASKIVVKPNFVGTDPGIGDGKGDERGPFALFAGRLDQSKGLETLLKAWSKLAPRTPEYRLKILGDGPLRQAVEDWVAKDPRIEYLGRRPHDEVYKMMGQAAPTIVCSLWYESFPLTVVESFSKGTPVIAANLGSLKEIVKSGRTGVHFESGNPDDLARQVVETMGNPFLLNEMRAQARAMYEKYYTARENYRQLQYAYELALRVRHEPAPAS